jgi:hypothetical protein
MKGKYLKDVSPQADPYGGIFQGGEGETENAEETAENLTPENDLQGTQPNAQGGLELNNNNLLALQKAIQLGLISRDEASKMVFGNNATGNIDDIRVAYGNTNELQEEQ